MKLILMQRKSSGDLGQDVRLADKFVELGLWQGKLPGIKGLKTNEFAKPGIGRVGQGKSIMVPQTICPYWPVNTAPIPTIKVPKPQCWEQANAGLIKK